MTIERSVRDRLEAAREVLAAHDQDLLVAAPGSDMAYLIGYSSRPSERPVLLLVPSEGQASIVIAYFESLGLPHVQPYVQVFSYDETDDPFDLVRSALGSSNTITRAIISNDAWSRSLLGLQALLPSTRFEPASTYLRQLRMVKDAGEIDRLREAGMRTDRAVDRLFETRFEGESETAVAERLKGLLAEEGLDNPGAIIAAGANGASPHHHPSGYVMEVGDAVVVDCGGTVGGYHSDITRTVVVGRATDQFQRDFAVVLDAQKAAVRAVRPGMTCESIDRAARDLISDAGLGDLFIHRTGHGVGLDGHEEPYLVGGNSLPIRPGMVFSVEPGVYRPSEYGIRIEDTVVATEEGTETFNSLSWDLKVVS